MTTKAATDDVRAAVFGVLDGAVQLPSPFAPGNPARALPVLEEVGDAQAPYIEMGAASEVSDDTHSSRGAVVNLTIHTWSTYRGFAEIGAAQREIKALLDKVSDVPALSAAGWRDVFIRVVDERSMRDEDPLYRHGVTDVEVRLTQEED